MTRLLSIVLALLSVALVSPSASAQTPKPAASAASANSAIPLYRDLKYPPLKQVKVPDVPSITLSNGMRVFMLEDHELPLVSGFALVRTGNLFDPNDKRGLAELTADVMRTGGTSMPLSTLTAEEQLMRRFALQLLRDKKLDDDTFSAAQKLLGTRGVTDLTLTCSYYTAINMAQVALKPEMEAGKVSTL